MMEKTLILKHISRMLCLLISYSKFTRTWQFPRLAAGAERGTIKQKLLQRVFSGGEREDKMRLVRQLDQRF